MKVHMKIKRFNPEKDKKPYWGEYDIEADGTDRVLDAMQAVKWELDGALNFRRSCAHGVCGSDAIRINGRNALACKVLIRDAIKNGTVTIEPILGLKVIKDLIVDMEPFFAQYRAVMPYMINETDPGPRERLQSQEERARYDDTTKCILCACCTTSCPSFWARGDYVGPAAIVQAHRFIFDSRDQGAADRLSILGDPNGVWRCRTIYNCTEVCPRDIQVTQAIGEVKAALITGKLD